MPSAMRSVGNRLGFDSEWDGSWWEQQAQEEAAVAHSWGIFSSEVLESKCTTPVVSMRRVTEVAVQAPSVR